MKYEKTIDGVTLSMIRELPFEQFKMFVAQCDEKDLKSILLEVQHNLEKYNYLFNIIDNIDRGRCFG